MNLAIVVQEKNTNTVADLYKLFKKKIIIEIIKAAITNSFLNLEIKFLTNK